MNSYNLYLADNEIDDFIRKTSKEIPLLFLSIILFCIAQVWAYLKLFGGLNLITASLVILQAGVIYYLFFYSPKNMSILIEKVIKRIFLSPEGELHGETYGHRDRIARINKSSQVFKIDFDSEIRQIEFPKALNYLPEQKCYAIQVNGGQLYLFTNDVESIREAIMSVYKN